MTRWVPNERGFIELVTPAGTVGRGVAKAAGKTRDRAKRFAPVDNGVLRNSIRSEQIRQTPSSISYRVGTVVPYGLYQHEGTGIYGPRHQVIRPRRAKMLRFIPKGGSDYVFAFSVKGSKPTKFLTKALAMLTSADFS